MSLENIYTEIDEVNKNLRILRKELDNGITESGWVREQIKIEEAYRKGLKKAMSLLNKEK